MSAATNDLLSLLDTVDAYLRTRVSLYLDFNALVGVEASAQRQARLILDELRHPGLLDRRAPVAVAPPADLPSLADEVAEAASNVDDFGDLSFPGSEGASETDTETEANEPEELLDFEELIDFEPIDDDAPELGFEPDEPTQVDIGSSLELDGPNAAVDDLELEEVAIEVDTLDLIDFEEVEIEVDEPAPVMDPVGFSAFPSSFEDESEDETILATAPAPLEPMPVYDEDVSDPATLGDPDETEDLLREPDPEFDFGDDAQPTFLVDDDEDILSEPRELAEIEIEEPGEDALVTIEDTSDPRSDLEGLSRLVDSDLDDDPDTGNDEVIVRTTEPVAQESFDVLSDSDFSPDDEETFVADLADIEKMKAKMASIEDVGDDKSENEVLLPPPEASSPRVGGPRVAPVAAVAGVAAAGVAGVRAGGPQVTAGLYGNPSVPQIRDRNAPKPRAAAIQIDAAQEDAANGGPGGALLDEEEVLALGSSEDYGEEPVDHAGPGGLSLDVQEYEEEYEEEEYEEEEEEDDVELEPEPVFDDSVDESEVARLIAAAEKAVDDGEMELAIDLYSDVLDNDPENAEAHVLRGRLHLDYGDYSRAMSDFMLAEELAPENPEPQIAVGDLYFARKDYSRAIGHFNDALKMDPNNAMAFCRRGISHYYRKHFTEALADLKQAQKLDDDIPNIRTYIAMAKKKAKR